MHLIRSLFAVSSLLLICSCGGVTPSPSPSPSPAPAPAAAAAAATAVDRRLVHDAIGNRRWQTVRQLCAPTYRKKDGSTLQPEARKLACTSRDERAAELALKALKNPPCASILQRWQEHLPAIRTTPGLLRRVFADTAAKMATCGKYDYVFQHMIHWGPHTVGAIGRKALEAMDRANLPVEKAYLHWISSKTKNPYGPKNGAFALEHYYSWRLERGGRIDCRPYVKAWQIIRGADEMAWLYVFFRRTRCTAAADYVALGLRSRRAKTRQRACMTLALIGGQRHIEQMTPLAMNDMAVMPVRGRRAFWVRDTCAQAIARLNGR